MNVNTFDDSRQIWSQSNAPPLWKKKYCGIQSSENNWFYLVRIYERYTTREKYIVKKIISNIWEQIRVRN